MKFVKWGAGIIVVLLVVGVLLAPIGPVPGFFIGGSPADAPETWPDTSDVHEIRLKVPGTLPRVVIIWVIDYAGELYVVGSAESGWVKMIGLQSPVEMRLEGSTYPLTATRLEAGWEPMMAAYVDKYRPDYPDIVSGFPSPEEASGQIAVFKLNRS